MTDHRHDQRYDRRVVAAAEQLLGITSHQDSMSLPDDRLPVPVAARLAIIVAELTNPGKVLWLTKPKAGDRARFQKALREAIKVVRRWTRAESSELLLHAVELPQLCGRRRHGVRLEANGTTVLRAHPDVDMALEKVSVALGAQVPACIRAHPDANTMWAPPVADDGFRFEPICAGELLAFVVLVRQWLAVGYDLWTAARALLLAVEPHQLQDHLALGMPLEDAIDWRFCPASEVSRWQECGFSADDAQTWQRQGRSLDSLETNVVRVHEGRWLARWARLIGPQVGTEAVVEWARFGQPVGVWGEAAQRGLRAPEVAEWTAAGFESVEILRYAHLRTPLTVACDWRAEGFTAYVACGYLGVGMTLADAVELRGLPVKAVQELWPAAGSVDAVEKGSRVNHLSDLLETYLVAREYRNASKELADWASHRYLCFARSFGLDPVPSVFPVDGWSYNRRDLGRRLFHQTLESYEKLSSPFDGYLEVSGVLADMYRLHHRPIQQGLETARLAMRDLLIDLLVQGWELSPDVAVSDADLRSSGFDPDAEAPDPDDFL